MSAPTAESLQVSVWRGAETGRFVDYRVPARDHQTVLDVVTHIQRHLDGTLSYRYACRVGMCGSCAMTVNGTPRWTCRTRVDQVGRAGGVARFPGRRRLRLAPLANLPVIKDLAVDMSPFFDKWARARGRFVAPGAPASDFSPVSPNSSPRLAADAAIECIGCGVCYAGCEVLARNPRYLGPAALNRAWTLANDVRDAGGRERLRAVAGDAGCHACHSHQNCTHLCPKHLNPTASIAGLKRLTARAVVAGKL